MSVVLRRLLILLILAGAAAASRRLLRRESETGSDTESSPRWPPFAANAVSTDRPEPDVAEGVAASGDTPADASAPTSEAISTIDVSTIDISTIDISTTAAGEVGAWVEPSGDACPAEAPIKAKSRSGIYHVPGGRFYDRTVPDRCYPSEAAAQADGYRRSSN
jgi:hypothetical protein